MSGNSPGAASSTRKRILARDRLMSNVRSFGVTGSVTQQR